MLGCQPLHVNPPAMYELMVWLISRESWLPEEGCSGGSGERANSWTQWLELLGAGSMTKAHGVPVRQDPDVAPRGSSSQPLDFRHPARKKSCEQQA